MNKNRPLLRYYYKCLLILIVSLIVFACGGGGGDGGDGGTTAWIRIDDPEEGYATHSTSVILEGNAAMRNGSYLRDTIYWSNGTHSGTGDMYVVCIVACIASWWATIPLDFGDNLITVRLIDGSDQVTVFRYSSVQGRITKEGTDVGIPDVMMTISGGNTLFSTRTDENGNYKFYSLRDGSYNVVPSLPAPQSNTCFSFSPSNRTFDILKADVVGQEFTAVQDSICYSISGQMTLNIYPYEAVGKLTLIDAYGSELIRYTGMQGKYTFYHLLPGNYSITPADIWGNSSNFVPSSISATIINSNLTNQNFQKQY